MVYTIADLTSYARSIDERLADVNIYTDSKIHALIEEALATAQDIRGIFYAVETHDLEKSITEDNLTEIEIILSKEPQSIYDIIDYDDSFFTYKITPNNHILIKTTGYKKIPESYKITIKYYFYPLMPFEYIELSQDSYRLVKEAIAAVLFADLRDYEQETYHRNKAKALALESAYDLEKDSLTIPFERFWRRTWV